MACNAAIHVRRRLAQATEAQCACKSRDLVRRFSDPLEIALAQTFEWRKLRALLATTSDELVAHGQHPRVRLSRHGRKSRTLPLSAIGSNGFAITPAAPRERR